MNEEIKKEPVWKEITIGNQTFKMVEHNGWECDLINQFLLCREDDCNFDVIGHIAAVPVGKTIFSFETEKEETVIDRFEIDAEFFFPLELPLLTDEELKACQNLLKEGKDFLVEQFEIEE